MNQDDQVQEVENEMMTRFEIITPEEGRKIVKELGVQLIANLKIGDVIPYQKESDVASSMYYSEDLGALATWDFTQCDLI